MADDDKDRNPSYSMFGLGDSETQRAAPAGTPASSQPGAPQYVYQQAPPPAAPGGASSGQIMLLLIVVMLVISGVNLYLVITARSTFKETAGKQADQLDLITRRLDSSDARYAQLRGQFQVTSERLGLTQDELTRARALATNIQKQQQEAVTKLNNAIAQKASAEDVNKVQAEANTKIAGVSSDLAGTKKDLADLTGALGSTKGELSGAIARTHDELVALAHKTDRDYFEFKLTRKSAPQRVGNVTIELKKTDTKRNTFTVSLRFDDKVTERKDKAAMEPVYFYMQGASSALELVVNKLGKDNIAGYISAPKGFFPNATNVLAGRPGE
jgi:hypothetical protein